MDPNLLFQSLIQADSTNNYATQQIREGLAFHGNAWFTSNQTEGKGQRGKRWESENGKNLAISIALQPPNHLNDSHFVFNMFVANTCASFLEGLLGQEISIKWPNDIFINDRKAGGILIENIFRGKDWSWSVVGIGLNLNQTHFSAAAGRPVSLIQITGKSYDPEKIARDLHVHMLSALHSDEELDANIVQTSYNNRLYRKNEMVLFKKNDELFSCKIREVNAQGELMVEGAPHFFRFGEVEWVLE